MNKSTLLTCAEVMETVRLSRSTIYSLVRKGQFPAPRKIGPKAVRWHRSEVESWVMSRPRAA